MISRIFLGTTHLPKPLEATSVATKTSLTKDLNSCTALFLSSWSLSPKKYYGFFSISRKFLKILINDTEKIIKELP